MERGEIWWVDFDPSLGDEIQKRRPAVILSEDWAFRLNLRILVPLTGWQPAFSSQPWKILIRANTGNGLAKDVAADAFQVKSLSVARLKKRAGVVTAEELVDIVAAVALVIGHPYPYGGGGALPAGDE